MIDLEKFYVCGDAAKVITRNSGHPVSPMYVVRMTTLGVLTPISIGGRNFYPREQVDGIKVRRKSRRGEGKVA